MPTCTVYFDGDCPVCRREIAHYQRQRGAEAIAWVDASRCDEAALGPGVDRAMVLSRFHVRAAATPMTINAGEGVCHNCHSATRCDRAGAPHEDVTYPTIRLRATCVSC